MADLDEASAEAIADAMNRACDATYEAGRAAERAAMLARLDEPGTREQVARVWAETWTDPTKTSAATISAILATLRRVLGAAQQRTRARQRPERDTVA